MLSVHMLQKSSGELGMRSKSWSLRKSFEVETRYSWKQVDSVMD